MPKLKPTGHQLTGAVYTPVAVAELLSEWVLAKSNHLDEISGLEPSFGEGVFFDALERKCKDFGGKPTRVLGVELDEKAYQNKGFGKRKRKLKIKIVNGDFFEWYQLNRGKHKFDFAVGNPPFIRYQNFAEKSRALAMQSLQELGFKGNRLTNSWLPFLACSVELLNIGGCLAMVIPAEILQVKYAAEMRQYLVKNFEKISLVACNEMLFDGIEQEVIFLLCERKNSQHHIPAKIEMYDTKNKEELVTIFSKLEERKPVLKFVEHTTEKWVKYFLSNDEIELMRELRMSKLLVPAVNYFEVDVGIVTGNNSFFVLNKETVNKYELENYVIPLIGRAAHIRGLVFSRGHYHKLLKENENVNLLDLNRVGLFEQCNKGLAEYLNLGIKAGVNLGYKCAIRKEWFKVPSIWQPDMFMYRQIYDFPILVRNDAKVTCTDTIHRVRVKENPNLIMTNYYTYLTAACVEIEGRSYGGGVLEIEPNEAEKLLMPANLINLDLDIPIMHKLVVNKELEKLLTYTGDKVLRQGLGLSKLDVQRLKNIGEKLRSRRINRKKTA